MALYSLVHAVNWIRMHSTAILHRITEQQHGNILRHQCHPSLWERGRGVRPKLLLTCNPGKGTTQSETIGFM